LDDFSIEADQARSAKKEGIDMALTWSPHFSVLHARPFPHWWLDTTHTIHSRVHSARLARVDRPRNPPRQHPARYDYLESACMAREMDRL
jgi:hypothetical protein